MKIVRNQIKTPDGTIIRSRNRHDYVEYIDSISGETYMVDGGISYLKRTINDHKAEIMDIFYEDGHKACRVVDIWGTYGINGDEPLSYISVSEMSDSHMSNILANVENINETIKKIILDEIEYRKTR